MRNKKVIIATLGYKGSGKDTTAMILSDHGFMRFAFADTLKDMVSEQYSIPREDMDKPDAKEKPILTLPVDPKDEYSKMLADFFLPEFRDQEGNQPYAQKRPLFTIGDEPATRLYHTPRSILITEGSTKRFVTSKYWVQRVLSQIDSLAHTGFVITDLRYRSELEQIKSFCDTKDIEFLTFRILREPPKSEDPSERNLDGFKADYDIDNTGNVGQLMYRVERALENIHMRMSF